MTNFHKIYILQSSIANHQLLGGGEDNWAIISLQDLTPPSPVEWKNGVETIIAGLVVFLDSQGNFHLIGHSGQDAKKLLQAAHRFFTRWVRLDI